jgi:ElaB/YqjD/DUF883 family membrane-anchored ribosome-binding protein
MSTISSTNSRDQARAGNAASQETPIIDKAKEVVGAATERVGAMASAATKKADQAAANAGSNIKNFGETVQEKGPQLVSDAVKSVGGTIEAGGKYLEEQGFSGMVDDVTSLIKRNPVPSILIGVGLGVLIGRALRS